MSQSNYHRLANGTVYSYSTCIRQEVGALSIGNITRYSAATSRHQSQAQCVSCDVLLDNVPQDTAELLTLALAQSKVYALISREEAYWDKPIEYAVRPEYHHAQP